MGELVEVPKYKLAASMVIVHSEGMAYASAMVQDPPSSLRPLRGVPLALTILIVALWGGNAVAVVFSVDTLPPVAVGAIRFSLGTVVMFFWCAIEGTSLWPLPRRDLWYSVVAAFLLFTQISTFNIGAAMTNATHSVMLVNTYIFGVALIEHFIHRTQRMRAQHWAGMALAFVGVYLLLCERPDQVERSSFLRGDLLLLVSAVLLAIRVIYVRAVVQKMSPSRLIFWQDAFGVLMFAIWSLTTESFASATITWPAIFGLLYQGLIVAGLCFVIQASLLRHHGASQVSVYFFATPVFGVFFSVALRNETLTPFIMAGTVFIGLGIWLASRIGKT
jgi:drug/metabolite transporter (DMT)-like permease